MIRLTALPTALRSLGFAGLAAAAIAAMPALTAAPAMAAEGTIELPKIDFEHEGIFGTYNRGELQRGYKVYKEVCAACHGMHLLSFRHLQQIGFTENEVKALAMQVQVQDGPNDEGQMFERPGRPSDRLPSPFPNEKAARAANGGAYPPDLSLMAKARVGGSDYIAALMNGYTPAPEGVTVNEGLYYNAYFPGHQIAMPAPIVTEMTYDDGTPGTVEQQAHDVAAFLAWAAEPHMEARKRMGLQVMIFLAVFAATMWAVKHRVWKAAH